MTCDSNVIITRDGNGLDLEVTDSEYSLSARASLVGAGTMFTNDAREAPVMGNAGNSDCTGTNQDTTFWGFQLGDTPPDYGCSSDQIGTYCGPARPRSR